MVRPIQRKTTVNRWSPDELAKLKDEITAAKAALKGTLLWDSSSTGKMALDLAPKRVLRGHFGKIYAMHWAGASETEKLVSASQARRGL